MTDRQRQRRQKTAVKQAYQQGRGESALPHITLTLRDNGQVDIRSTMGREMAAAVLTYAAQRVVSQLPTEDTDGGYAIEEPADDIPDAAETLSALALPTAEQTSKILGGRF